MPQKLIEVWVCDACGAKFWPQVAAGMKRCPACSNPTGKIEKEKVEEAEA